MTRFLLRRLLWLFITTWLVVTISFFMMRAVPGGPFDQDRAVHAAVARNLDARYHLDWPAWRQYLHYVGPLNLDSQGLFGDRSRILGGLVTGDLGPSFRYRDYDVNEIIAQSLPISALLGLFALLWALTLGLAGGALSAWHAGRWLDVGVRLFVTAGIALPNFAIAGFLILLFAFTLDIAPVAGWGTFAHMLLPGLALGAPFAAYIARLTRTGLLESMSQEYMLTARAKGLPPRLVLLRHGMRGALLPVVSFPGPATAGIPTGSLVIEKIFAIPGTGSHFVNSALNRDYTLALGVTVLYTVLVYSLNTVVDVAYALLDPRIEIEG